MTSFEEGENFAQKFNSMSLNSKGTNNNLNTLGGPNISNMDFNNRFGGPNTNANREFMNRFKGGSRKNKRRKSRKSRKSRR